MIDFRRQILTSKDGSRAERVKPPMGQHFVFSFAAPAQHQPNVYRIVIVMKHLQDSMYNMAGFLHLGWHLMRTEMELLNK